MRLLRLALPFLVAAAPLAAQWEPQSSGITAELRGLSVASRGVVWASGAGGQVARTTDGGRTWHVDTVPGAARLDLRGIASSGARIAWAMSAGPAEQGQAKIFKTSDGGATWRLRFDTTLTGVFLDAIAFWDASHGIAMSDPVDGRFFLLVTDDGGETWKRVPPAAIPTTLPGEAAFAASNSCLTVHGKSDVWIGTGGSYTARVFHSADRGRTWSVAETAVHARSQSSGIFSVAFRDTLHGVAVGGDYASPKELTDNVAYTEDGGRTWRIPHGPLPAGYMSAVAWVPAARRGSTQSLVAVGLAGTAVSEDGGASWRMVDSVAYNSVAFAAPNVGWAVGPKGRIAKWIGSREPRR